MTIGTKKIGRRKESSPMESNVIGFQKLTDLLLKTTIEFNKSLSQKYSEIISKSIEESTEKKAKIKAEKFTEEFLKIFQKEEEQAAKSVQKIYEKSFKDALILSEMTGAKIEISAEDLLELTKFSSSMNKDIVKKILELIPTFHANQVLEMLDGDLQVTVSNKGKKLIKELKNCKKGKKGWKQFEDICVKILEYCFIPPIERISVQIPTDGAHHKRDIMVRIPFSSIGMWGYFLGRYGTGLIIDCKNYTEPIGQSEVHDITKYLGNNKPSTLGIILSRTDPSESAITQRKSEYASADKKLIIFLKDEDLEKMIELKDAMHEPASVIERAITDFIDSIP